MLNSMQDTGGIVGGTKPTTCSGRVEFSEVSFSYPARPHVQVCQIANGVYISTKYLYQKLSLFQILKELNLVVEPGQKVAIVGPSGTGKSTILQLIQHLYSPTSGQVIIQTLHRLHIKVMLAKLAVSKYKPFHVRLRLMVSQFTSWTQTGFIRMWGLYHRSPFSSMPV